MSALPRVRAPRPPQIAGCLVAVALSSAWAFWPVRLAPTPAMEAPGPSMDPGPARAAPSELRIAAFSAPLWVAPPAPPPPPAPKPEAPAPPPLKLQLLAVVDQDGVYEAVLFDPDTDTLYSVREGATLGPRTVERVDPTGVALRDDSGTRTLALKDEKPAVKDPGRGTKR